MNEGKDRKAILKALTLLNLNSDMRTREAEAIKVLEQALAPEPRFYKNQPVLVRDVNTKWQSRILSHINDRGVHCFRNKSALDGNPVYWEECKPDPEAESIINWVEHDGSSIIVERPLNCSIHYVLTDGVEELCSKNDRLVLNDQVARYAIIPLPEFLS